MRAVRQSILRAVQQISSSKVLLRLIACKLLSAKQSPMLLEPLFIFFNLFRMFFNSFPHATGCRRSCLSACRRCPSHIDLFSVLNTGDHRIVFTIVFLVRIKIISVNSFLSCRHVAIRTELLILFTLHIELVLVVLFVVVLLVSDLFISLLQTL